MSLSFAFRSFQLFRISAFQFFPFAAFAALYAFVCNHLWIEWYANPQYSYGWSIPFLALYLFRERWFDRPEPGGWLPTWLVGGAAVTFAFLLFPIRLVHEANRDWALSSWAMTLCLVGISFCALLYAGGWRWLRHFAFPAAFILIAVEWPAALEAATVNAMMASSTGLATELLSLMGIAAEQKGNLIEVTNGLVGVNEACSGIRSFQGTLMISLFLGELYRFGVLRRAALLLGGIVFAYACNVVRTTFLAWIGATKGVDQVDVWHDSAGLSILVVSFIGLWAICWLLRQFDESSDDHRLPTADALGAVDQSDSDQYVSRQSDSRHSGRPLITDHRPLASSSRPLSNAVCVALLAWLALGEAGTQGWYGWHESKIAAQPMWDLKWPPVDNPTYRDLPIAPEVQGLLRFSEGRSGAWTDADGKQWQLFFFRWFGNSRVEEATEGHRPEICIPSAGLQMVGKPEDSVIDAGGILLPTKTYAFDSADTRLTVFYSLWDPAGGELKSRSTGEGRAGLRNDRLVRALEGRRNRGQILLEAAVTGEIPQARFAEFAATSLR